MPRRFDGWAEEMGEKGWFGDILPVLCQSQRAVTQKHLKTCKLRRAGQDSWLRYPHKTQECTGQLYNGHSEEEISLETTLATIDANQEKSTPDSQDTFGPSDTKNTAGYQQLE